MLVYDKICLNTMDNLADYNQLNDEAVLENWFQKVERHIKNFIKLSDEIHEWSNSVELSGNKLDSYIQKFNENCYILDIIEKNLTIIEDKQKELFNSLSILEKNADKASPNNKLDRNTINQLLNKVTSEIDKLDNKVNRIIESINDRTNLNDTITSILNEHFFALNYLENQIKYTNDKINTMKKEKS